MHCAPIARLDEIEIVGMKVGKRKRDPAMPKRDEPLHRLLDRRLEIRIDPCVSR